MIMRRMRGFLSYGILGILALGLYFGSAAAFEIPLSVKDSAGTGATDFPVSAVVPFPTGALPSLTNLALQNPGGNPAPLQCEVLERWREDGSLRHVLVHFQASVPAGSNAVYTLRDGAPAAPAQAVSLTASATNYEIVTGPLKIRAPKNHGGLLDAVWFDANTDGVFAASEQVLAPHAQNGGVFVPRPGAGAIQYDAGLTNLTVEIEESGPLRVVIRLESQARFISTNHHRHGFAARLYAYAGQAFIKVDYQLQNSDRTVVRSWPLYFDEMRLDFRLSLDLTNRVRFGIGRPGIWSATNTTGFFQAQESHSALAIYPLGGGAARYATNFAQGAGAEGFVDVSDSRRGAMACLRHFWEMWPNGLEVNASNRLSLQLFPAWSQQFYQPSSGDPPRFGTSGLYWLEDMQHVRKECFLFFHGPGAGDSELQARARVFQNPPVVAVPAGWRREARATLDLGGVIPGDANLPAPSDRPLPAYDSLAFTGTTYGFNWALFGEPEPGYRRASCTTGGWPYEGARFFASQAPADFIADQDRAMGELNVRPEWMAGYRHDTDWPLLRLTENPYCGGRWRIFEGHGVSKLAAPPLPDTGAEEPAYYARDDQHGWFYHVAEAYFSSGDPWLRDWYRFVGEFRRARLGLFDPWPDYSSRATGHSLNHALQAYRATGDTNLLVLFRAYIRDVLRPSQDRFFGDQIESLESFGGGFQTGYLMRALVDYLEEVRDWDPQAFAEGFNYLSGLMEWNLRYGRFPYYFNARAGGTGVSSGTGFTLIDPQAWYYWNTGRRAYWDQIVDYMDGGIAGGESPYGNFGQWSGQFEGRYYLFVKGAVRGDTNPPPAAAGVRAVPGGGRVLLKWTASPEAVRHHVVWALQPITEASTTNSSTVNWWAANAIGAPPALCPGQVKSLVIAPGTNADLYAAVFGFDSSNNMSAMSAVATTAGMTPDTQAPQLQVPVEIVAWTCPNCPFGAVPVFYAATASDHEDPNVTVTCHPPAGTALPPGTTFVECVASDFAGNATTARWPVVVRAGEPPLGLDREDDTVLLTLPMFCTNYAIESATGRVGAFDWTQRTLSTTTNRGRFEYLAPARQTKEFFRLRGE